MQPAHEKADPNADSPEAVELRRSFAERMRELMPLRELEPFAAPLLKPNAGRELPLKRQQEGQL